MTPPLHYTLQDTAHYDYEGDSDHSAGERPMHVENERLRREIRTLRLRNDALQRQVDNLMNLGDPNIQIDTRLEGHLPLLRGRELPETRMHSKDICAGTIESGSNADDDASMDGFAQRTFSLRSSSSASEHLVKSVERLAAHLNPGTCTVVKTVQMCDRKRRKAPKIKVLRKWATPQRLWTVDFNSICRRGSHVIIFAPTHVPTEEGEVQQYQLDTAPFAPGDTREIVHRLFNKWYYLGTFEITSVDTLFVADASRIRPPHTTNMAKDIARYHVLKKQRAHMLSMLENGTSQVYAFALTRVGSNEELIKHGQGEPKDMKKVELKKAERVRRLLTAASKASPKKALRIATKKHQKVIVKKEEPDSD